jgi:hypothetical protein
VQSSWVYNPICNHHHILGFPDLRKEQRQYERGSVMAESRIWARNIRSVCSSPNNNKNECRMNACNKIPATSFFFPFLLRFALIAAERWVVTVPNPVKMTRRDWFRRPISNKKYRRSFMTTMGLVACCCTEPNVSQSVSRLVFCEKLPQRVLCCCLLQQTLLTAGDSALSPVFNAMSWSSSVSMQLAIAS